MVRATVSVPKDMVGRIIGRKGETIRRVLDQSGVRSMDFKKRGVDPSSSGPATTGSEVLEIGGPTEASVAKAKERSTVIKA